mgnify:CR=1 FL=1
MWVTRYLKTSLDDKLGRWCLMTSVRGKYIFTETLSVTIIAVKQSVDCLPTLLSRDHSETILYELYKGAPQAVNWGDS